MEEGPRAGLVGRARELRRLGELAGGARAGRGGTLVLRGEAGTGKTALIAAMLDRAPWLRRIDCSGAGSETAVGYAGVQRLCVQAAGLLDLLPDARVPCCSACSGSARPSTRTGRGWGWRWRRC